MTTNDTGNDRARNAAGMGCSQGQPTIQQRLQLGVAVGVSHGISIDLLEHLERAQFAAEELQYAFDKLPEAYQPGSDLWEVYDEIRQACIVLHDARTRFLGGD